MKTRRTILLTGAGFSANFGGFLANEMFEKIYNHPGLSGQQSLKDMLVEYGDFETVYDRLQTGGEQEQLNTFRVAVEDAYRSLDETTCDWIGPNTDNPGSFNVYKLRDFLELFQGNATEIGLFATLNQDLIVERQFGDGSLFGCKPPGVKPWPDSFYLSRTKLEENQYVRLPSDEELMKAKKNVHNHSRLLYIKPHGSYGWLSADGSRALVVGRKKKGMIEREPLLKWHFELLEAAIEEGRKRLVIIGYSFRDEHINNLLIKGVKEYGLKLIVFDCLPLPELKERIPTYCWNGLGSAIEKYFPYNFQKIFPPDQSETTYWREIRQALRS